MIPIPIHIHHGISSVWCVQFVAPLRPLSIYLPSYFGYTAQGLFERIELEGRFVARLAWMKAQNRNDRRVIDKDGFLHASTAPLRVIELYSLEVCTYSSTVHRHRRGGGLNPVLYSDSRG